MAALGKEFEKAPSGEVDENWVMIYGDFWPGNVLIPMSSWKALGKGGNKLYIIDWGVCPVRPPSLRPQPADFQQP